MDFSWNRNEDYFADSIIHDLLSLPKWHSQQEMEIVIRIVGMKEKSFCINRENNFWIKS